MLRPLEQWICDRCGGLIATVEDGWLEWIQKNHKAHSFKIVHHCPASPRKPEGNCYHHTKRPGRSDNKLDFYVGRDGIPKLLSFLDLGPYHDPEGQHIPLVSDMGEFTDLMRFEPPDIVTDNIGME